jgi:hypothetical protein
MSEPSASPPLPAEIYSRAGVAAVEQVFLERQVQAQQNIHTLDRPEVFADVLALSVKENFRSGDSTMQVDATATKGVTSGGRPEYRLELLNSSGSGVAIEVDDKLNIRVTGIQARSDGQTVPENPQSLRWIPDQNEQRMGYLEHEVGKDGKTWLPNPDPALASGNDMDFASRSAFDNAFAADRMSPASAAIRVNAPDESPKLGIRAVTQSNRFGMLQNGYAQDGTILYDGFTVVEQNVGRNRSTVYNKDDLLVHASDPQALQSILASPDLISLSYRSDTVDARTHDIKSHEQSLSR